MALRGQDDPDIYVADDRGPVFKRKQAPTGHDQHVQNGPRQAPQGQYIDDRYGQGVDDIEVIDLDGMHRPPGPRSSPISSAGRGRSISSPGSLTDPRFAIPLALLLAAVLLIGLALRARSVSDSNSTALSEERAVIEGSELAQRVQEAELRAGFDGLSITEQDGTIIIEGQAADATTAASIGAVARSVDGTQRVDNRVVVAGGAVDVAPTPSTVAPIAGAGGLSEQLAALGRITFETGSADLTVEGAVVVDGVAGFLARDIGAQVEVHGHTDTDGDNTRNQVLSQERAEAVVTALVGRGIAPSRLSAIGFGESQPIEPNITEEGRAANRRIEFLVIR